MMRLSSPIYKLKRQAKLRARSEGVKLHEALDQVAANEGFNDWSHLASSHSKATPARRLIAQVRSCDLVLIGARPGHGKTLLGLELAALAEAIDRAGYVFTLDYNEQDAWDGLQGLGFDPETLVNSVTVDTSDKICADYIVDRLKGGPDKALVVIDYLQLLDSRRRNPPLGEQVQTLKHFAAESGAIVAVISQIDRAFDLSSNGMPNIDDIRLPNPVDLSLFNRRCFLHGGEVQIERAG